MKLSTIMASAARVGDWPLKYCAAGWACPAAGGAVGL